MDERRSITRVQFRIRYESVCGGGPRDGIFVCLFGPEKRRVLFIYEPVGRADIGFALYWGRVQVRYIIFFY